MIHIYKFAKQNARANIEHIVFFFFIIFFVFAMSIYLVYQVYSQAFFVESF